MWCAGWYADDLTSDQVPCQMLFVKYFSEFVLKFLETSILERERLLLGTDLQEKLHRLTVMKYGRTEVLQIGVVKLN